MRQLRVTGFGGIAGWEVVIDTHGEDRHASAEVLPRPRPKVVAFAYACEPGRGSEPGAGWGLVRAVAEFCDCTVLVGPEHVLGIRAWEAQHPGAPLRFVEVPEPSWARFNKGDRIGRFLVYLGWLRNARRAAEQLHAAAPFEGAFHATYAVYWLPSPATELGLPSVWGPVGGAVVTPWRLWPILGWKGFATEILDLVSVRIASSWPRTRRTWRQASVRIVQNAETRQRLPKALRESCCVLNHAGFVEIEPTTPRPRGSHLLWISRLERRKAPALAVRALARSPRDVRLWIVGTGPEQRRLDRLARRIGVAERIRFLGDVPRRELPELLAGTSAAVFTGVREEGGLALAEAMVCGTPVIVLDHGGPSTLVASATDPSRVHRVAPGSIGETVQRLADAMTLAARRSTRASTPLLDQTALQRAFRLRFAGLVLERDRLRTP